MSAQVSLELHHRISQFLFHEASLLDDWNFVTGWRSSTKRFVTPCAPQLTRKHATAAKASSHRQLDF